MNNLRVVSTGDKKSVERLLYLLTIALQEARIDPTPDQLNDLQRGAIRLVREEGWTLTRQVK